MSLPIPAMLAADFFEGHLSRHVIHGMFYVTI
jgi:hypothetical protein